MAGRVLQNYNRYCYLCRYFELPPLPEGDSFLERMAWKKHLEHLEKEYRVEIG